jgi:cytochrome c oxidase subunit 2
MNTPMQALWVGLGLLCHPAIARGERPSPSPVERGERAFVHRGCFACHRLDGSTLVGPPLNEIFGTRVLVEGGRMVPVDEAYLRESIVDPRAAVVAGYAQHMTDFNLSAAEVEDLVAFIRAQTHAAAPAPVQQADFVARGQSLFAARGCRACHGSGAREPAPNPGAIGERVPELQSLAERMMLDGPAEARVAIGLLERGVPALAARVPPPFPSYPRFVAQLQAVRTKIEGGGLPAPAYPGRLNPPLHMPAWRSALSAREIDAVIAYLIMQQRWDP